MPKQSKQKFASCENWPNGFHLQRRGLGMTASLGSTFQCLPQHTWCHHKPMSLAIHGPTAKTQCSPSGKVRMDLQGTNHQLRLHVSFFTLPQSTDLSTFSNELRSWSGERNSFMNNTNLSVSKHLNNLTFSLLVASSVASLGGPPGIVAGMGASAATSSADSSWAWHGNS